MFNMKWKMQSKNSLQRRIIIRVVQQKHHAITSCVSKINVFAVSWIVSCFHVIGHKVVYDETYGREMLVNVK